MHFSLLSSAKTQQKLSKTPPHPSLGVGMTRRRGSRAALRGGGPAQPHQSGTWQHEAFMSSPSSALSSQGRRLTLRLCTAAAHHWVTRAFHVKPPRSVPRGLQGAVRTSLFAGEHSLQGWGPFLFPGPPRKLLQELLAQPAKGLSQLSDTF